MIALQALYFDIRKGAHSVGSNVRDAACYVLWSLARAQRPAVLAPYADNLSRRLVTVALFDREIHIRRAASATFQEFVGRTVCRTESTLYIVQWGRYIEPLRSWHRRPPQDGLLFGGHPTERVPNRCARSC